ncbi:P-loop NTPase family protein [Nocardia terpenica]|uniref:MinD-like ATPase involved in chromosome partitioning or flagellar assembly n=1 Tax=Nocardia terpenica TaxID=455432 RepID=A0A291RQS5_9NOCA|nr:hypothetical protein [Nocardia terpenica]ATL69886.1 hypothetical protein CRH09_30645 [Nocardia terpenica]
MNNDQPQPSQPDTTIGEQQSSPTEYDAEAVVDLRRQRLRPTVAASEPDEHDADRDDAGQPVDADATEVADPYGVGEHNLRPAHPDSAHARTGGQASPALLKHADGVEMDPAEWGWRGRLNALRVTRLRPVQGGGEVAFRRAIERIRQPLPGTPVIMVANPKGGTGVTPATLMLANVFGLYRGGGVVAWDNNEARGTLAARAATTLDTDPTVSDVLANARALCSANADAASLARFLRLQPTLDEVLASDQAGDLVQLIGRNECAAIMAVLRRHRSMVLIDTGDNDRAESFGWSIENATQLAVPLVCRRDATYMALRMLETIAARGRRDLATGAVVALAEGTATDPAARDAVLGALDHAGITQILPVPLDPVLAGGDRIVWSRLSAVTTRAWTHVAAAVADGLAEALSRSGAPLEAAYLPETYSTPTQSCDMPHCGRCRTPGNSSDCPRAGVALPRDRRPYSRRR